MDALKRMLSALKFNKEPVLWLTGIVMALLVFKDMRNGGKSLDEVLTTNYIEYLVVTAGALVARFMVFAKGSVMSDEEQGEHDMNLLMMDPPFAPKNPRADLPDEVADALASNEDDDPGRCKRCGMEGCE